MWHLEWEAKIQTEPGGPYAPAGRHEKRRASSIIDAMDEVYRYILQQAGEFGKILDLKFYYMEGEEEVTYEWQSDDVERAKREINRTMQRRIEGKKS